MTNKQYQEMLEEKYNKPLKEIMYELCVTKSVVPTEGANILGVPKKTFTYWRTKLGFGPLQIQLGYAEEMRNAQVEEYSGQLKDVDLARPFSFIEEPSLDGLTEVLERYLELYKRRRIEENDSIAEISIMMQVASLEQTLSYINDYRNGTLHDRYMFEAKHLKNRD